MTARELADLMRDLGCRTALNMDGGGSSAMLLRGRDGGLMVVNQPSDRNALGLHVTRPVPVMLGIRRARVD